MKICTLTRALIMGLYSLYSLRIHSQASDWSDLELSKLKFFSNLTSHKLEVLNKFKVLSLKMFIRTTPCVSQFSEITSRALELSCLLTFSYRG